MQASPTQIVLLGGGYVSVWAYRALVKQLRSELNNGTVQITVVCPESYHLFHGWTAESLTNIIQNEHRMSPLAEVMPRATLVSGKAWSIDPVAQVVHLQTQTGNGTTIRYDHLLLGIGSYDSEAVAGIRTHGYQVKSQPSFLRARRAIQDLVNQAAAADAHTARQLLQFTVAGGGFTGVELATNLAEYVQVLLHQHPSLRGCKPQIRLINRGDRVLTALEPGLNRLVRYAEKTMQAYGIEVISHTSITAVTPRGAQLSDGRFLESRMVISTVGQSQFVLAGTETMPRDDKGRLLTNACQQVAGLPNVWGGGDACHIDQYNTGAVCPPNALWAIKHGHYAGRNIARAIRGKALKPFTYPGLGQSASLGLGKGIGELYGIQFTGLLAWVLRWFFFLYFMPSRRCMLATIGDWFYLLVNGQRRGLSQPEPAAPVKALTLAA